jgi:hypothetical protein
MLHLRPHHLTDIIRNIGHNRPLKPHPYGHAQHLVTQKILDGSERSITLVVGADDLCLPCIHLQNDGLCNDVLPQLEIPMRKQTYNDDLDHRLLLFFGLHEGNTISLYDFLCLIEKRFDKIVPLCLHPKEDLAYRREGLRKGLEMLLKIQKPLHENLHQ